MFHRVLTLNHVHDRITVKEGNERITLLIDADVTDLARKCKTALSVIERAREDPEARAGAGLALSKAIFGEAQTRRLLDFYGGNEVAVLEISVKAFTMRLASQIEKAQRKAK